MKTAAREEVALDVDGLRMRYGSVDVLRDVTFQVRHGEVLALLGPNGAGKTTTIEILEGFRARSAGRVQVLGADPAQGDERWRARVGVVLQSWRDHGKWRVRELLAHLGGYYAAYSTAAIRRPWDPDELVAAVGLTEHAGKKIKTLSGGQRRRLDVAIGIVGRPELLFLDEPTTGFDPEARHEFHALVHRLAADHATTILLTTHDLDEAGKLADRVLILAGGRIIADGSVDELARRIAGEDEVRWTREGERFTASTADSTAFVRGLFGRYGEAIGELEVRRASLEDTYRALVRQSEDAAGREPARSASAASGSARRESAASGSVRRESAGHESTGVGR
ncbi:ABC transporter ATP-binding protein [Streptomyces sp. NPDC020845]|uniref:ABC transporter ATP-binding protein n=1 Tax=Streptomyces sp. NPDC020845 TaxID=3365096 RepID=UPI00379E3E2B